MNLRTSRPAALLLWAAGLLAIVASEATSAEGTGSARAQSEIVGVFTGRFTDGMPVYRFPPVLVVANRKAELAKIERAEQLARARALRAKAPVRPPASLQALVLLDCPCQASGGRRGESMHDYKLEHICSYTGRLASPPEVIGPLPEGIRVNFYSTGGEITGPSIRGKLRSVGGDWVTVRKDGVAYLDTRATFETHDSALILVTYQGVVDFGDDGHDTFLRGELPPVVKLRTAPRFVTSHPEYVWLNRLFCVGVGEYRTAEDEARYDVYAVR